MIKVNLLKNRAAKAVQAETTQVNFDPSFFSTTPAAEASPKDAAIKIILLILFPALLWGYETYHIDELTTTLATINREKADTDAQIQKQKVEAEKAKVLQKEVEAIESRVKTIKDLSSIRLREIKSVDFIQNVIPERVWLTALRFDQNTLQIEGGAVSDDQLTRFVDALEGKSYFRNVIVLRSVEQKIKAGAVKVFQITSTLTHSD